MRKNIFSIILVLSVVTQLNAGFFGSIVSSAIGSAIVQGNGSKGIYMSRLKKRMDRVNSYLWHMHETGKYEPSYKFYKKWLLAQIDASGFDDIAMLDTIAWVLKDHGKKREAIKLYETRILPWIDIRFENDRRGENKKFREKWKKNYEAIKK